MNYAVAALVAALGAGTVLAQPPGPGADLRRALQQYHPVGPSPRRELTPGERAELRRQLAEFGRAARTPPNSRNDRKAPTGRTSRK